MGVAQKQTQPPMASPSPSEVFHPFPMEQAHGSAEESLGDREAGRVREHPESRLQAQGWKLMEDLPANPTFNTFDLAHVHTIIQQTFSEQHYEPGSKNTTS